jgi:membrane-associated protease RseP (regulator of RpoE activity)
LGVPGSSPWMPPPTAPGTEIERIRASVAQFFPVYETRVTPQSLVLMVHADPATLPEKFDRLRRSLWDQYYIPQIRYDRGEYVIEVVRRPNRVGWGSVTNIILLALTVITTMSAGAFLWLAYVGGSTLTGTDFLWGAITFGRPLMTILGLHELAHFVTARHHHVEASLPFFIPVPPPFILFGTFGAFISLREPIPDKKALLDIGASGPLAGFLVAIPVTVYGMFLSAHTPALSVANCGPVILGVSYGNFVIGTSLFWFVLGKFVPAAFASLHPVALAGWVGLLVTAINLLPAGQLDGGHVFRALLGDRSRYVSYAAVVLLFGLGVFLYQGWIIFAILILFLGMRHPPPLNDITPLDGRRVALGVLAAAILVTGFVAVPIAAPSGNYAVPSWSVGPAELPSGAQMADNLSVTVVNHDLVPHGYLVSGTIDSVISTVDNVSQTLSGSELAAFEANSTWTVHLPNGNVSSFSGAGTFQVPSSEFFTLSPSTSTDVTVTYSNTAVGVVLLEITVGELCSNGLSVTGPISTQFTT